MWSRDVLRASRVARECCVPALWLVTHCHSSLPSFVTGQATEWIVDTALAQGKPFAVVPCCVFADDFPARIAADGTPVTSYAAFLDYLQAKPSK